MEHSIIAKEAINIVKSALKGFFKSLSKRLFIETYRLSDSFYRDSKLTENWHDLGPVQFYFHIDSLRYPVSKRGSFLVVKTKDDKTFYNVKILVITETEEQIVQISKVGKDPKTKYLHEISELDLEFLKNGLVDTNCKSIKIKLLELYISESEESKRVVYSKVEQISYFNFNDYLDSTFKEEWGVLWNIDLIEEAKTELRNRYLSYLITYDICTNVKKRNLTQFIEYCRCWIMSRNQIVNTRFWIRNIDFRFWTKNFGHPTFLIRHVERFYGITPHK
jgi:hypothetical protein